MFPIVTNKLSSPLFPRLLLLTISVLSGSVGVAQEPRGGADVLLEREGNRCVVPVAATGTTRIPRVCASLRRSYFEGMPDHPVAVHPEREFWELKFSGQAPAARIVLEFDSYPALLTETKPIQQAGDGTLSLPACMGRTVGEKLRFEPQPQKNTIGYWVVATDSVFWPIVISQPATFNVGILQGAGAKGGGVARISLMANDQPLDAFEYRVEQTGHFQNFIWNHAGTLKIDRPGEYVLKIEAASIDDVALMDVREVSLTVQRSSSSQGKSTK